jgi:hypothetical protein
MKDYIICVLASCLLFATLGICLWLKRIDERSSFGHRKIYSVDMKLRHHIEKACPALKEDAKEK